MTCAVCQRDEKRMNSEVAECSHVECPHRRRLTACSRRDAAEEQEAMRDWLTCGTAVMQGGKRIDPMSLYFDNPLKP